MTTVLSFLKSKNLIMNFSNKLTIVILTHNRINEAREAYKRVARFGVPIVIAESSTDNAALSPLEFGGAQIVRHQGGFEVFPLKVLDALKYVKTPYVVLTPDDDALHGNTLSACLETMLANPGVSACQGNYVNLIIDGKFALPLPSWGNTAARSSRPDDLSTSAGSLFYAVQRTESLKKYFDCIADSEIMNLRGSPGLVDSLLTAYLAIAGQVIIIDNPYLFRTKFPGTSHSSTGNRADLISSVNLTRLVDGFVKLCDDLRPIDAESRQLIASHIQNLIEGMIVFDRSLANRSKLLQIGGKYAFARKSFWTMKFVSSLKNSVNRRIVHQSLKSSEFSDLRSAVILSRFAIKDS